MAQVIPPVPIIPQRRPRDEPEIIDVDLLDDEITITGYGRSQRRRLSHGPPEFSRAAAARSHNLEVIVLSDDEGEGSNTHARASGPRRRLVSPPPPPRQVHRPPPVPSFPLHVLFPRRSHSHAPQIPPPAIIPNPDPFDFEAHLQQPPPPRQPTPPPILPPRGAPVSHHQPVMGLGGAILALNRPARMPGSSGAASGQRPQGARDAEVHRHSRLLGMPDVSSWVADLFGIRRRPEPRTRAAYDFWPLADLDLDHFDDGMPSMDEMLAQARQPKSTEVMWQSEYTHEGLPQPGYTFHFHEDFLPVVPTPAKHEPGSSSAAAIVIPDDDPDDPTAGPSSAGPSTVKSQSASDAQIETGFTLVCSRCMDPLVLPDDDGEAVSAEERKGRRVWGLRCGHVLDGKCVHNLMRPPVSVQVSDPNMKGKGKMTKDDKVHPAKRRYKGKVKPEPALQEDVKDGFEISTIPENTMRSRLRPRHPRQDAATVASALTLGSAPDESLVDVLLSPRRRERREPRVAHPYAKPKGKGRPRKPVVLEQYEWQCPVSGCGHLHRSVLLKGQDETVDGGWSMDPEKGAIAMFL